MAIKPLDQPRYKWVRVSKDKPCVICGHKSYCTRTSDGCLALCMRVNSDWPSKGKLGGWIHKLDGEIITYDPPPPPVKIPLAEWTNIAMECATHAYARGIRMRMADELGVSYDSLLGLCVGYGWDDYRHIEYSTWPQFNHRRQVTGIVRRYHTAVTDSGGNKLHMRGGGPGLHYVKYGSRLGKGPLCIVEGGSDVAALVTLGLPAIGRPSNLGGVDMLAKLLKKADREIIIIGERDRKSDRPGTAPGCPPDCTGCNWCYPGLFGAKTAAEELLGLLPGRKISWAMVQEGYKDSRMWLRGHPRAEPRDFIDSLENC